MAVPQKKLTTDTINKGSVLCAVCDAWCQPFALDKEFLAYFSKGMLAMEASKIFAWILFGQKLKRNVRHKYVYNVQLLQLGILAVE